LQSKGISFDCWDLINPAWHLRTAVDSPKPLKRYWTSDRHCDIYFQLLNPTFIWTHRPTGTVELLMTTALREYNITSLQRGLRMLQLLGQTERGLPASEIAKRSGLPVSTVHRFLVNLESGSFLMRDNTGNYHLGVACVFLGQAAREQLDVRTVSLPHLHVLNQRTRETVHLTVRHGLSAVYIEKLDSPQPLRIHSRVGASVPLYCSAVGKVLLAYMSDGERERLLGQLELRRFTENTVGSVQELQTQLARVRKNGHAYDLEEHEPHVRCVAAPVWDHGGAVNASLSVTGPAVRMSTARLREIAPLVRQAGMEISRELGYDAGHSSRHTPHEVEPARRAKVTRR
jgi:IclR family acetate operon transcriptional repressor